MHSSASALATVSRAPRMDPLVSQQSRMGPRSAVGRTSRRSGTIAVLNSLQPSRSYVCSPFSASCAQRIRHFSAVILATEPAAYMDIQSAFSCLVQPSPAQPAVLTARRILHRTTSWSGCSRLLPGISYIEATPLSSMPLLAMLQACRVTVDWYTGQGVLPSSTAHILLDVHGTLEAQETLRRRAAPRLGEEEQLGLAHAPPARHVGGLAGQQAADVVAAREAARLLRLQHRPQQPWAALWWQHGACQR